MNNDELFGFSDISNYFVNIDKFNEINIKNLQSYLAIYQISTKHNILKMIVKIKNIFNREFNSRVSK